MSTDAEWEKWGERDPYFAVLTDPRFRRSALTEAAREDFFALGRHHAQAVLDSCRKHLDPAFAPRRVLDFGCGIGRVLMPFAATAAEVVGVDVSLSMLAEAGRNCERAGLTNVELLPSDDSLSRVQGVFDLVHSALVLQHVDITRGLRLFDQLVRRLAPGGIGAIQVAVAWDHWADNQGVQAPPEEPASERWWATLRRGLAPTAAMPTPARRADADPEMQMNFYNLSQLIYLVQSAGITQVHVELTTQSGVVGAFLFFQRGNSPGMQPIHG